MWLDLWVAVGLNPLFLRKFLRNSIWLNFLTIGEYAVGSSLPSRPSVAAKDLQLWATHCRYRAVLSVAGITISLQVITGFHHVSCWSHWWLEAIQLLTEQPQCTLSSLRGSKRIPSLFVSLEQCHWFQHQSGAWGRARGNHLLSALYFPPSSFGGGSHHSAPQY